ncbi:MAG TPA: HAD-IIIA family hydrolase [Candidatus Omnitrophota bacterium]|nr:HAD-IIIA family hydrolase [Candidatus Omnitrophota bacterium]
MFLDRDGVINEFPGNGRYVTTCRDFYFIPGALEAIRNLTRAGYTIFVVSNQAGVGKGLFTKKKLDQITRKMLRGVRKAGGRIKKVFYSIRRRDEGCTMRKPAVGSIKKAMQLLNANMRSARKAYFVGDTEVDIQTGKNIDCKTIFVLSGREDVLYMRRWDDVEPDYIVRDLLEASKLITGYGKVQIIRKRSKLARIIVNKRRRKIGGINLGRRLTDRRR